MSVFHSSFGMITWLVLLFNVCLAGIGLYVLYLLILFLRKSIRKLDAEAKEKGWLG